MATQLYKYSSDQGRSNSFKHLSKQNIHINTFNIFSKVDRNHTLPKIVWTVVSTNLMFYKGSLRLNIYILAVFTEKAYSKPLERNVVYIPIITLSHATSHDFK